jgi:hypothetical protein
MQVRNLAHDRWILYHKQNLDYWVNPSQKQLWIDQTVQIVFPFDIVAIGTKRENLNIVPEEKEIQQSADVFLIGDQSNRIIDENFFVAVAQECARDRTERIKYRYLLSICIALECAIFALNDQQNFILWMMSFLCSKVALLAGILASRRRNISHYCGMAILFGLCLTVCMIIAGLLLNHSILGFVLICVEIVQVFIGKKLLEVVSPLWFCPTFA